METNEQIKDMVRQKYSEIALQDKETNEASCCGSGCCSTEVYNIMSDDYTQLEGYNPDADLGLGCGLPTQFAQIKKGDVVIDLGSGAGNDAFIARKETGETGLKLESLADEAPVTPKKEEPEDAPKPPKAVAKKPAAKKLVAQKDRKSVV